MWLIILLLLMGSLYSENFSILKNIDMNNGQILNCSSITINNPSNILITTVTYSQNSDQLDGHHWSEVITSTQTQVDYAVNSGTSVYSQNSGLLNGKDIINSSQTFTGNNIFNNGITISSFCYIADKLGVGLTIPNVKLDVNGILRINGAGTFSTTSQGLSLIGLNNLHAYKIGFDDYGTGKGFIRYNTDTAASTHGHVFSAGTPGSQTDLLKIFGSGEIQVPNNRKIQWLNTGGTATAYNFLDTGNSFQFRNDSVNGNLSFIVNAGGDYTVNAPATGVEPAMENEVLSIDGTTRNVYLCKNGGNMGIGNITPSELLQVNGNIRCSSITITGTSNILITTVTFSQNSDLLDGQHGSYYAVKSVLDQVQIDTGTLESKDYAYLSSTQTFTANNTFQQSITFSNYVYMADRLGIGTTRPGVKLAIESNQSGGVFINSTYGLDHWPLCLNTNASNDSGFWESSDDIRLILRDNGGNIDVDLAPDRNSYITGGNVGIGIKSPATALHIIGTMTLTGIIQPTGNKTQNIGTPALSFNIIYVSSVYLTTPDFIDKEKAIEWLLGISTSAITGNKLDKKTFGNAYRPARKEDDFTRVNRIYFDTTTIITNIDKDIKTELSEDTTKYYYEETEELKAEEGLDLGQTTINLLMAVKKQVDEIADLKKRIEILEKK